ncbi:MAG TPA: hypothetical protein VFY40_09855 [Blastocatellia bacterium]|nr:hypothetical protein [Blastocatellia bacterium]
MDLIAKRVELQGRANELAIQESNIAERREKLAAGLAALDQQAVEINRLKHQTLGAITAIDEIMKAEQ